MSGHRPRAPPQLQQRQCPLVGSVLAVGGTSTGQTKPTLPGSLVLVPLLLPLTLSLMLLQAPCSLQTAGTAACSAPGPELQWQSQGDPSTPLCPTHPWGPPGPELPLPAHRHPALQRIKSFGN